MKIYTKTEFTKPINESASAALGWVVCLAFPELFFSVSQILVTLLSGRRLAHCISLLFYTQFLLINLLGRRLLFDLVRPNVDARNLNVFSR